MWAAAVHVVGKIRALGVVIDCILTMLDQMSAICQTRYCQLVYTYTDTYTSGHKIRAWSVSADARRPTLAGYSLVQYKLAVTVHRWLRHWALWYLAYYHVCCLRSCWSPASAVCQRSSINCQFREFALRRSNLGTRAFSVWNSLPDHLRVPLVRRDHLCDPAVDSEHVSSIEDVSVRRAFENVSAKEVLRNRALQIDIYLLTYLLTFLHTLRTFIYIHT